MLGNEEDFTQALGFRVDGLDPDCAHLDPRNFKKTIREAVAAFSDLQVVATTLRHARTATVNNWGALCWAEGAFHHATPRQGLEILDRVGGGDSCASGLVFGLREGRRPQWAVECGAAHGAPAMTTLGDTSMATRAEVERVMACGTACVQR